MGRLTGFTSATASCCNRQNSRAPVRDRADLIDDLSVVGEGQHDHLLAGCVVAQLDVGAIVNQPHGNPTLAGRLDGGFRVHALAETRYLDDTSLLK